MENGVCKISWKLIENWRSNRRNSSTTVNVNPGIDVYIYVYYKYQRKLASCDFYEILQTLFPSKSPEK